jgi:hypothetical protein
VGVKGLTGHFPIGGTDAADFKAKLDTFRSKLFIPMVSKLKGMGQLSDAEGKKLTQAAGALDERMPEKSFKQSLDDIISGLEKARARRGGGGVTVVDPRGVAHTFPNQAAAEAFRKEAGIQ